MTQSEIMPLVWLALTILGRYFLNQKAGEKGWYAFIPFYATYLTYKYANRPKSYFIVLITTFLGTCLMIFFLFFLLFAGVSYLQGEEAIETYSKTPLLLQLFQGISGTVLLFMFISAMILFITGMIFKFKQCRGLALHFHASKGFAWVLFFFNIIGTLILALDEGYYYEQLEEIDDHNPYYDEI